MEPERSARRGDVAPAPPRARNARGATAVAGTFSGRAQVARSAWVDGAAGAVWAPGGRPRIVFAFTISGDRIVSIELVADPERLGRLDLAILGD